MATATISTGVYGYPKENAAFVAVATVREWIEQNSGPRKIIFVCFDDKNFEIYQSMLDSRSSP
jgi:O-acetyl-ADP-ribose deacetylase (regulator of RNase III)